MNQQFEVKKTKEKIGVTKALMGHLCSPIVMTIVTQTHTFTRDGTARQTNQYLGNHWIQTNFPFCYHFFVFRLSCSGSLISFPCFFSPWIILLNVWFFFFYWTLKLYFIFFYRFKMFNIMWLDFFIYFMRFLSFM